VKIPASGKFDDTGHRYFKRRAGHHQTDPNNFGKSNLIPNFKARIDRNRPVINLPTALRK
jgi:hypothetical protein